MDLDYFPIWQKRLTSKIIATLCKDKLESFSLLISTHALSTQEERENWLKELFRLMHSSLTQHEQKKLLESCGRACLMPQMKYMALKIFNECSDLDEFVNLMNKTVYNEDHLTKNGTTLFGCYSQCYCPIVRSYKVAFPDYYCLCSQGWLKELYEKIFKKGIQVTIMSSIIRGDKQCTYKIDY